MIGRARRAGNREHNIRTRPTAIIRLAAFMLFFGFMRGVFIMRVAIRAVASDRTFKRLVPINAEAQNVAIREDARENKGATGDYEQKFSGVSREHGPADCKLAIASETFRLFQPMNQVNACQGL